MTFSLFPRWNFPSNNNGPTSGISDNGVETFNGNRIKSLAREICQNSIDANEDPSKPTKVQFSVFEIPVNDIPGIDDLKDSLNKARYFWEIQNTSKAKDFFDKAINVASQNTIKCLRISDFNTTGLCGSKEEYNSPWCNLTKSQGVSDKVGSQGGSFGIGGAAVYTCSMLRTIFYSTLDNEGQKAYQGVARLTSFKDDDGDIKQGMWFYGNEKNTPVYEQIFLDPCFTSRNETGTDIYILGFIADETWKEKMIASVLDGFLYAVFTNKLCVDVDGVEISQSTLNTVINQYKEYCEEYADEYYTALTSDEAKIFEDDNFMSMGKVTLYLMIQQGMNRRVAMVRKTGMKIMGKKNFSRSIPFSGLLYIEGAKLNEYLRSMENPQHTLWETDRADDPAKAKKVLNALTRFIKDRLNELKNDSSNEEIDPSVGEYLTAEPEDDALEKRAENLNDEIKEVNKREIKVRKPQEAEFAASGDEPGEVDDEEGDIDIEDVPGSGGRQGEGTPDHTGIGGGSGFGDGGGHHPTQHKKRQVAVGHSKLRIIADGNSTGNYTIAFTPSVSAENGSLAVFLSSESSDNYEVDLLSAKDATTGSVLTINGNKITGLDFIANTPIKVKVKLDYNDYCSMEVKAYGHKV